MQVTSIITAIAGVIAASSLAAIAYLLYARFERDSPPGLWKHRLDMYSDISHLLIRINRLSTELHQDERYELEKDKYASGRESEYDELIEELIQKYQEGFYIIDKDVKDNISEFIDYMSKIHPEGPQLEEQLSLAGKSVSSMRDDLNLEAIYTDRFDDEGD